MIIKVKKLHSFVFCLFLYCLYYSTAKVSEVSLHVHALLNRHSVVFGNYRWTEFDEDFLRKHVESVAIVDIETLVKQVCCFGFGILLQYMNTRVIVLCNKYFFLSLLSPLI